MNNILSIILKKEVRQFFTDPMTILIGVLPFLIAVIFRLGIPPLTRFLTPWLDMSGLEPFWAGLLIMMGPMLFGFTGGFLFLDEKDQGLLPVLKVTPVSDSLWVFEKTIIPMLITLPGVLIQLALCGLVAPFHPRYILLAILAALEAPFLTLAIAAAARDKVQGMTMGKTMSLIMMPPLLIYFIDHPLIHLSAISPPYWILQTFRYAEQEGVNFWIFFTGGLFYHIILGVIIFALSRRRIFR
ncbi:MAG: hypothetical protein JEY99_14395 [Spirochaetales bacterium]|nr:hypothetical protein [Spirochaetales bacterium]